MLKVICRTEGCESAGIECIVPAEYKNPLSGVMEPSAGNICGACHQEITDVTETEEGEE